MDSIGREPHKRESRLCLATDDGEVVQRCIVTRRERSTAVVGARPPDTRPVATRSDYRSVWLDGSVRVLFDSKSRFFEIVTVDALHYVRALRIHSDVVVEHQAC